MAMKLNWLQVEAIRAWRKEGWSYRELGDYFKVSPETIAKVVKGKTWKGTVQ